MTYSCQWVLPALPDHMAAEPGIFPKSEWSQLLLALDFNKPKASSHFYSVVFSLGPACLVYLSATTGLN